MSIDHSLGFTHRFALFLTQDMAQKAAQSIADQSEIEFRIQTNPVEVFTFIKLNLKNEVNPGPSQQPHFVFSMTPDAAESILQSPTQEIGEMGIEIVKLILSNDEKNKIQVKLNASFFTLLSSGYFGVIQAGGRSFASFLATKGLKSISEIQKAIRKMR